MKISNVARLVFWVAVLIATGFLVRAESGEQRAGMPNSRSGPLVRIVDQNGRPAISGVPSGGGQTFDVTVAPGGSLTFSPSTVNISVGDTVRWTWAASGHSVTSGDSAACTADGQFCSPSNTNCTTCTLSNLNFVYEFTFTQAGSFSYFCCAHCGLGMTGVVNVAAASPTPTATATATTTATATATATPTATSTSTPSGTPTVTPSATATSTATGTPAPKTRPTPTPRPRPTPLPRP
jgi:plastocyanin